VSTGVGLGAQQALARSSSSRLPAGQRPSANGGVGAYGIAPRVLGFDYQYESVRIGGGPRVAARECESGWAGTSSGKVAGGDRWHPD
jgi:hypothetical protein